MVARSAMARARWRPGPDALFLIELNVFRAQRAGDWDNFAKAITDALTKAGAWRDDRYIEDARVRLFVDREYPRVDVLVQELVGCAHCRRVWACVGKACPEHEAAS
jgi:Holliday junction resolvase RusA-like endonuclease